MTERTSPTENQCSKLQPQQNVIPVVLVESHQHVLEHIHDVLRKKKLFQDHWSMVHFDAHPDLACSKTAPAIACFNPRLYYSCENEEEGKNLYEILDLTSSGIAEWILPLVLAANLNRIEWIKPGFSSQIARGDYQFSVGVEHDIEHSKDEIQSYLDLPESARIKVDFQHPYYLDDSSVTSTDKLLLSQNLDLKVTELPSLPSEPTTATEKRNLWTLDICLDYFACHNPYITDLENRNSLVASAFLGVMEGSIFNIENDTSSNANLEYQTEIICFYKILEEILRADRKDIETRDSLERIQKYFHAPEHATRLLRKLLTEIHNDESESDKLASMVIEAIPNWSMPHDTSSAATERLNESLRLVEAHIRAHVAQRGLPFLVTIARSTLDGFCPPKVVELLQSRVLDILGRQICGADCQTDDSDTYQGQGSSLLLVRDYGEWEGSIIPWERIL